MKSPLSQLQEMAPTKRSLRAHLRHVEKTALRHAHKFIIQRISSLRASRRHAIGWLFLVAALVGLSLWQGDFSSKFYTAQIPAEGGIYTEGALGNLDNINPILASSPAERSASRLLFAQLLRYDDKGDLVGELADSWRPEQDGKAYVITLRQGAKWQDGQPINADDVVFTFDLIKNADTRSPLYNSWRNIVVEKVSDNSVRFTLPSPYSAFPNSLALGMLPKHTLKDIKPAELRTSDYNLRPSVASGPFVFEELNTIVPQSHELLRLKANSLYLLGRPKLDGFHLHAYKDSEDMVRGYRSQEVASLSDVTSDQLRDLPSGSYIETDSPLFNGVYAFLNNSSEALGNVKVRQALQYATDLPGLLKPYGTRVRALNGPLLPGQLGYRQDVQQPALDLNKAKALLDQAGWVVGPDGVRQKDGHKLLLRLATTSTGDFPAIAEALMNQWQKVGVSFDSELVKAEDIQQNVIVPRSYDILLYEIALDRDPDVFAYWHSSQANERGLNLSQYKSSKVDEVLDTARTRLDPGQRDAKYRVFAQQWINDAPAIALYRTTLAYVQNKNVVSFNSQPLVSQADRYFNVRYWAAGKSDDRPTR